METIQKNAVANFAGQGWAAFLAIASVPVYVKYLGVESYGLIGVFSVLQSLLLLLDFGMAPTLNREVALCVVGKRSISDIRSLMRSMEFICSMLIVVIAVTVFVLSTYIASSWVQTDSIPVSTVSRVLLLMSFTVGFRIFEGIYRGVLYGLERQVLYNMVYATLATFRYGGAILVIAMIAPDIEMFFVWQAVISLLTVVSLAVCAYRMLPKNEERAIFSLASLLRVKKFAVGMTGISVLTVLLLQTDKIVLSRLVSLTDFGYYTMAATAANVLFMMMAPVMQAVYPRLVQLSHGGGESQLIATYHKVTQIVILLTAPACFILVVYPSEVIYVWSGNNDLQKHIAPILPILVFGSFVNVLSYIPTQLQIASGRTGSILKANTILIIVLSLLITLVIPQYQIIGAAWVWLTVNFLYLVGVSVLVHKEMLRTELIGWYVRDLMRPILLIGALVVFSKELALFGGTSRVMGFTILMGVGMATTVCGGAFLGILRMPRTSTNKFR